MGIDYAIDLLERITNKVTDTMVFEKRIRLEDNRACNIKLSESRKLNVSIWR